MNVTNRAERVDEKKWDHLSSFHVSFLGFGPQVIQKSAFLQFCADLSKKYKSVKAIYICSFEGSHYTLSEGVRATVLEISAIKIL